MVDVVKELEALRQNLLDLSLRNNLLNYRPSQRRTISISGRKPKEIYELFVLHEKSLRFRAKTQVKEEVKNKIQEALQGKNPNDTTPKKSIQENVKDQLKNKFGWPK